MDPYSCNLKDIMPIKNIKKEKNEEETIKVEEVENNKIEKSEKSESLLDNLYSKLKDKLTKPKSIKIIILTLLAFLFLTSEAYLTVIKNNFPMLISAENAININGKIIGSVLTSLILIFFI